MWCRALGYITDDVPFAVQRRGRETYVTVSVGKAWQVSWSCGVELPRGAMHGVHALLGAGRRGKRLLRLVFAGVQHCKAHAGVRGTPGDL